MPKRKKAPGPMEQPSALYEIHSQKVSAGLEALLFGPRGETEDLAEYLALNRVILGDGGFCLLLAAVQFQPGRGVASRMDANSLFADLLEARLVRKMIYYMLPIQGIVLCLTAKPNLRPEARRMMDSNKQLLEGAEAAVKDFSARTEMDVLCTISPTCYGVHALSGTYQHTKDHLDFCSFFGREAGIYGTASMRGQRNLRLSSEFQENCVTALNLLIAGQQKAFFQAVAENLSQIELLVPDSLQQYKMLCYQFLDRLCYDLIDHHLGDAGVLERTDLYRLIGEAESFSELTSQVQDLLGKMLAGVHIRRRSGYDVETMKVFLQAHSSDCNLTVSSAAEQFGMSQPVFSAYFTRESGVRPLEYINKLRVAAAQKLLQTTDASLEEIGKQAGFGSVSTLHRVFRKYAGITPAQARVIY